MSMRHAVGDVALSGARGAGTHTSAAVANPGAAAVVILAIHVTAASGTSPTLAVSLEQSADGTTWTAIPGSAAPAITAAGNVMANAAVTMSFVRVVAVVGGTTPSFTFSASALVFAE